MNYKKRKILDIEEVYTAHAFQNEDGFLIGAGSETKGEVSVFNLSTCEKSPILLQPGGMMSFVPIPGMPHLFVSIMGFFPGFKGMDAGIYLHTSMESNWESGMALALPLAHRCETIVRGGKPYLIAASVSTQKDDAADWSRPGEIHVVDLDQCEYKRWKSIVIDKSITRNHGMCKAMVNGIETVYVSGREGIFSIELEGEEWRVNQWFYNDVSEMTFFDLDGDGDEELITIEPFHGNTLNIYKKDGASWEKKFSDELSFGHGLSAGTFKGETTIMVGNRSGSLALEAFVVNDLQRGTVDRRIIEEGVGATMTQVFTYDSKDYILSANQKKNEVVLYS